MFGRFARLASRARMGAAGMAAGAAGLAVGMPLAICHGYHGGDGDSARIERLERQVEMLTGILAEQFDVQEYTGQQGAVFSWDRERTAAFPLEARPFERGMHGGFTEDPATGIVYTGVPGFGLCAISPDLLTWTRLGSDPRLKNNMHGLTCFEHGGQTRIAAACNEQNVVLIMDTNGVVKQELRQPAGGEFNFAEANAYYSKRPRQMQPWRDGVGKRPDFACTDVCYANDRLYVVTGYCDGDFVLSAEYDQLHKEWRWGPLAWGGKGTEPGKFQTAHGIFSHDGRIFVANREAHQVVEFTPEGKLVRIMPDIPDGARICNLAKADDYYVMNALEPIGGLPAKTAPIYAHTGERLLSTIEPGSLGIPVLKHLHHVWPHYHTDKAGVRSLYILIHGWSAGKFAVLKHAPLGAPSEPACFTTSDGVKHPYPAKPGQPSEFKHVDVRAQ